MILNQVCDVAPQGTFDNVWRHLGWSWLPGQVKWRWHLVCRDEGCCCECPTMHVAAPITNNDPAPKISSAKIEELCSKSLPCWSGSSSLPYRYMSYMLLIWLTSTSPRASQMTALCITSERCQEHSLTPAPTCYHSRLDLILSLLILLNLLLSLNYLIKYYVG